MLLISLYAGAVVGMKLSSRDRSPAMKKGLVTRVEAGLMYLDAPRMGRRRCAVTRNPLLRFGHCIDEAIDVTSRHLTNHAIGLWTEMRSFIASHGVSDKVSAERVGPNSEAWSATHVP